MVSAAGHGWEQGDLVTWRQHPVASGVILINRDPDDREIGQRQGIAGAAGLEPGEQVADRLYLGGRIDLLLGQTDPASEPGEIDQLHALFLHNRGKTPNERATGTSPSPPFFRGEKDLG